MCGELTVNPASGAVYRGEAADARDGRVARLGRTSARAYERREGLSPPSQVLPNLRGRDGATRPDA